MNKNLKRIIAIALAIGTVSAVAPAKAINVLTTNAYASTDDDDDDDEFDSLEVLNKDDNNIKVYEDKDYDDRVDDDEMTSDGDYYIKTSSSKITLDGSSNIDDDRVKVFKGKSDSTKGKDLDDEISLTGDTTITVRVFDEDVSDETIKYGDDDDDFDISSEYVIHVEYTGSDSDDEDDDEDDADDYDDIYLEKLTVDGENISLSDDKVAYSYNVPNSTKEVYIKAVPEDEDDDDVTIDGSDIDDSDSWKKKVSLNEGANKFEIEVENDDDDDSRTYTLTINRAKATTTTNTNTATTQPNTSTNVGGTTTTAKVGWVQVNGRWQYLDSFGRQYKSQWFFDRNYGKWYYLGADGNMYTGWLLDGGKYYYLNADGSMASNTTIGGYKVGSDGAWIR